MNSIIMDFKAAAASTKKIKKNHLPGTVLHSKLKS